MHMGIDELFSKGMFDSSQKYPKPILVVDSTSHKVATL